MRANHYGVKADQGWERMPLAASQTVVLDEFVQAGGVHPGASVHWWADGYWPERMVDAYISPATALHTLVADSRISRQWADESDLWQHATNGITSVTVRKVAKVVDQLADAKVERLADADALFAWLAYCSGAVVETDWYPAEMERPDRDGRVEVPTEGEHARMAYVLDGIGPDYVRAKTGWGRRFGRRGFITISTDDMRRLMDDGGHACVLVT